MFSGLCLSISCTFFQGYLRIQKAKQRSQTEVKQIFLSRTLPLAYTLEQIFSAGFHHLTLISGRSHPIYTNLYQQSCQLVTITDVPDHSIFWNNQKVLKQKRNRLCAIYKMRAQVKHDCDKWAKTVIFEPFERNGYTCSGGKTVKNYLGHHYLQVSTLKRQKLSCAENSFLRDQTLCSTWKKQSCLPLKKWPTVYVHQFP